LKSFTKFLQRKNIRYSPIKHENVCVPILNLISFYTSKNSLSQVLVLVAMGYYPVGQHKKKNGNYNGLHRVETPILANL